MPFSAFSKEFTENMYTSVENQFITKYLPWADGDAVRAYLYGLYLCSCKEEFDAAAAAKLLKIDAKRFTEIFEFWEECGLVHILSKEPLFLEYLPVSSAVGKPKPIKAEKYADFNRELLKRLQKAGKDFKPYEMQKILEFLENERMEQQAFLLVVEYCMKKDGEISFRHVMNKAKQLAKDQKFTYEQVEGELASFNKHEQALSKIFSLLGIFKKPQESDFERYETWLSLGFREDTIEECARSMKKGSLPSLDLLLSELKEKNILTAKEARAYLERREELLGLVFSIARKLGVKVQSPRVYMEEYAEKWVGRGYGKESLLALASLSFKLRYGFSEMDALIGSLYQGGVVGDANVKAYCSAREKHFKTLQAIQSVCGVVNKTQSALDTLADWERQGMSESMILAAAQKAAGASSPIPYMNKLLTEWKRTGATTAEEAERLSASKGVAKGKENIFKSEAAIAADRRTDREHHYAILRQRAQTVAETTRREAMKSPAFREADGDVKKGEIELARAEMFDESAIAACRKKLAEAQKRRLDALRLLGIAPEDLEPKYCCPKCSDTGYLPDGRLCDCYQAEN